MKNTLTGMLAPLLSFLLLPPAVWPGDRPQEPLVRIAILQKVESAEIGCEGAWRAAGPETGRTAEIPAGRTLTAQAEEDGVRIGKTAFDNEVRIVPESEECPLRVNGRAYRGSLLIKRNPNRKITLINELDMDGYLYGILPKEVSPSWPEESLKAQAVVSRTYALNNLKRHGSEGFNLCNKVHCQVYGGLDGEKEETNRAVEDTRQEVLTYDGALTSTVFFSNCGGRTEAAHNVWETNSSPPYLKSVRCRFCRHEPHFSWERAISQEDIAEALRKGGKDVRLPIKTIQIESRAKSGRAKSLRIKHASGNLVMRASHFRMMLGPDALRSTLLTKIKRTKKGFYFKGNGWGHGVGFCQEGGKGMAENGSNYKKILRFYYPGTRIEKWDQ